MSGVRTGSRIEQLELLLVRVQQELATERLKAKTDQPDPRGGIRTQGTVSVAAVVQASRPDEVHIGSIAIKRWAHAKGLIPTVPRGRVHPDLVEAYEREHGVRVVLEAAK